MKNKSTSQNSYELLWESIQNLIHSHLSTSQCAGELLHIQNSSLCWLWHGPAIKMQMRFWECPSGDKDAPINWLLTEWLLSFRLLCALLYQDVVCFFFFLHGSHRQFQRKKTSLWVKPLLYKLQGLSLNHLNLSKSQMPRNLKRVFPKVYGGDKGVRECLFS